ncbi:putative metal-binding motif-containing protein [Thermodesulfobacteriota bacterium]
MMMLRALVLQMVPLAATAGSNWYPDADFDGYGGAGGTAIESCLALHGYATNTNDCNDNNASINPGATDICDTIDNNCNGQTDEDAVFVCYSSSWSFAQDFSNYVTVSIGGTCSSGSSTPGPSIAEGTQTVIEGKFEGTYTCAAGPMSRDLCLRVDYHLPVEWKCQ